MTNPRLPSKTELRALAAEGRKVIDIIDGSPLPSVAPGTSRKIRRWVWKIVRVLEVVAE